MGQSTQVSQPVLDHLIDHIVLPCHKIQHAEPQSKVHGLSESTVLFANNKHIKVGNTGYKCKDHITILVTSTYQAM